MKFEKQAAQGDLLITRVDAIPPHLDVIKHDGPTVLAHSETGHHHAIAERFGAVHYRSDNPLVSFLEIEGGPALLEHHRSFDTHAPIDLGAGKYEIRRQREYTPEGWRRVED